MLDQLITESRMYKKSKDYKDLLDFVVRLKNFAPFNAMVLQVQKPGLTYAASAHDWRELFERRPKEGARPLLILWPFGPVALVYDVMDTEGKDLPEDVACFWARGIIDDAKMDDFKLILKMKNIEWEWIDAGDARAGSIRIVHQAADADAKDFNRYKISINRNHNPPVKFATLVHELGHLFLGHLGPDKKLKILQRPQIPLSQQELEAESVSYLVCKRNDIESKSSTYLANYVENNTTVRNVDLYKIMRAAGQVESILGIAATAKFDRPV